MYNLKISLFIILLLSGISCYSGNNPNSSASDDVSAKGKNYFIAFYNVENLFDANDDPNVDDAEFTPSGKENWTNEKYEQKISNIARVIKAMNNGNGADILGLSEVENKGVLEHLCSNNQLQKLNYKIVHRDSPDGRGIDVAMIYKKNVMQVLNVKSLHVDISAYGDKPTRDVLLVSSIVSKDTIYFFLNHWPSRREGKETSEAKRIIAASVVKASSDSILKIHPLAKIIIMGDLNDNPTDKSVVQTLNAYKTLTDAKKSKELNPLVNPTNSFDWKQGVGSEFYKGEWSRFIQIIVSVSSLGNQDDEQNNFQNIHLFKQEWMLKEDETTHQMIPLRTFNSNNQIGFSDHLPVYIILKL